MFKRLFTNYAVITRVNRQEKPYQLTVVLTDVGSVSVRLYDNLTFTDTEDNEDTDLIIKKKYKARYFFNRRNQGTEESFDSYLVEIRNVAKSCNFCDYLSDSLVTDRIVMGVCDAGTRKHLLHQQPLTLQAAMDSMCGRTDEEFIMALVRQIRQMPNFRRNVYERQIPEISNRQWRNRE